MLKCWRLLFILLIILAGCAPAVDPPDPRAPPVGVAPGSYSYEHRERWRNFPGDSRQSEAGTDAASCSTTDRTDGTDDDEWFDYGSSLLNGTPAAPAHRLLSANAPGRDHSCDGSCQGGAPVPVYPPSIRSGPPAPAFLGERAPFWYEREGQYREPDWPGPGDPATDNQGLFARLRARRNR